jgi:Flp pilus assembly protein TadG
VSIQGPRRSNRRSDRRRGQALVEFALVVPLFLLLVAGMIDFGMGLASSISVTNAAREGARLGIITPNSAAIETRARSIATGLDQTKITVTSSCSRPAGSTPSTCTFATAQSGDSVVVRVDYGYKMIWPLAMGTTINMSSAAQMRLE